MAHKVDALGQQLNSNSSASESGRTLEGGSKPGEWVEHEITRFGAALNDVVNNLSKHVHVLIRTCRPFLQKGRMSGNQLAIERTVDRTGWGGNLSR